MTQRKHPVQPGRASWNAMWARCTNPKHHKYARYGGRGIIVCERWKDFEVFMRDVGPRPSARHTIGRIDNDKGYEPTNVRWETPRQQQSNISSNVNLTHDGQTFCVSEWARRIGISTGALDNRLAAGWPLAKALTAAPYATTHCGRKPGLRVTYEHEGKAMTLSEWARELDVARMYLLRRRDAGHLPPSLMDVSGFKRLKVAKIRFRGKSGTIAQWAEWTGLTKKCIRGRWEKGWKPADILRITKYHSGSTPSRRKATK